MIYFKQSLKKIIMAFFLIYGYNNFVIPINMTIPINFLTVIVTAIFGIPSLLAFVIIKIIFFS